MAAMGSFMAGECIAGGAFAASAGLRPPGTGGERRGPATGRSGFSVVVLEGEGGCQLCGQPIEDGTVGACQLEQERMLWSLPRDEIGRASDENTSPVI
jgi:hypothetical protein